MEPIVPRFERIEAELADLRRRLTLAPPPARAPVPLQVRLAIVLTDAECGHEIGPYDPAPAIPIRFVDPDFEDLDFAARSSGDHDHALDANGFNFLPYYGPDAVADIYRVRTIPPGTIISVAWSNGRWWVLAVPEIYLAKVQTGFSNYGESPTYTPADHASVKLLAADETTEVGDAFDVYLDVPEGFDPYLFDDDVIRICCPANRRRAYTVTPIHHLKRGNPMLWAVGSVPRGFQLADGTNGTTDWRGRFLRFGSQAGGDVAFATGGYDTHGETENNHDPHPDPDHTVTPTTAKFAADAGGVEALTAVAVAHDGPDWSHSDSDNRPEYVNLDVIVRVS